MLARKGYIGPIKNLALKSILQNISTKLLANENWVSCYFAVKFGRKTCQRSVWTCKKTRRKCHPCIHFNAIKETHSIRRHLFSKYSTKENRNIAEREQFPLMLGYGITISIKPRGWLSRMYLCTAKEFSKQDSCQWVLVGLRLQWVFYFLITEKGYVRSPRWPNFHFNTMSLFILIVTSKIKIVFFDVFMHFELWWYAVGAVTI